MNVHAVPVVKGKKQTVPPQAPNFKCNTCCEIKETNSAGAFTVPSVMPQSPSICWDEWRQYYAILGMPKLHSHFTHPAPQDRRWAKCPQAPIRSSLSESSSMDPKHGRRILIWLGASSPTTGSRFTALQTTEHWSKGVLIQKCVQRPRCNEQSLITSRLSPS